MAEYVSVHEFGMKGHRERERERTVYSGLEPLILLIH